MDRENLPKVSIITVCFNAAQHLEDTIRSVISQTYPNIEYIIQDGLSKDGTMDIVRQYAKHIDIIAEEADQNNFDAMNKAAEKATGDYIWFLHAGDLIYNERSIELAMNNHEEEDFIYGKTVMMNDDGELHAWHKPHPEAETLSWRSFRNGMIICHQSMLIKRSIWLPYDLKYDLVGDLDWSIRILKRAASVRDTRTYLCRFLEGGISAQTRKRSLRQRFKILIKHFGLTATLWQHLKIGVQALRRGSIGHGRKIND